MYRITIRTALLTVGAAIGFGTSLFGQSLWPDQTGDRAVAVEFLKPDFEGDNNTDLLTSATFLSGRLLIGQSVVGEAELPFVRYGIDTGAIKRSESSVGNPYLGVRIKSPMLTYRVGVRVPIATDDDGTTLTAGRLTDYDRFEAFLPDVFAIKGSVMGPVRLSDLVTLDIGGGPVILLSTKDNGSNDLWAQYFVLARITTGNVTVKSGLTGVAILTESNLDFSERTTHQFGLGATLNLGTVRPGLLVRIPLQKALTEDINYVVGLNVTVVLP